jgi:hypothetical protein
VNRREHPVDAQTSFAGRNLVEVLQSTPEASFGGTFIALVARTILIGIAHTRGFKAL